MKMYLDEWESFVIHRRNDAYADDHALWTIEVDGDFAAKVARVEAEYDAIQTELKRKISEQHPISTLPP